jgi:dihydrolipoamide dehydrogenase
MYDVVVIGGGPGGYAASIRASQLGGRVALVESGLIGGTCVNFGCIPTKVWHWSANLIRQLEWANEYGVKAQFDGVDLTALKARKDGVSGDIRMGMEGLLGNNGVDVIVGRGVLKGPKEVDVDGQVVEGKSIIISTGSVIDVPGIPGLEDAILTTNEALDMETIPGKVLVWGDGAIEVEMAAFLKLLGAEVIIATADERVLPKEDRDTSQRVAQGLRGLGVDVVTRYDLKSVSSSGSGFKALLSGKDEREDEVDRVLVGARKPNVAGLGLDGLDIKLNGQNGIQVNDRLETATSGVFAIGDAIGGIMLSHAATAMGITAAENAMGQSKKFPHHLVPRAVWSFPEVGSVGLTEDEADDLDRDIETDGFPYSINGLAMAKNELDGAVKVIFDPEFGEILGVHIVGAGAVELVGEAVLAMQLECTVNELTRSIRAHPTYSESVVDGARAAAGWALYLPKR